ncbi:hypothetical protein GCM10011576_19020 [Micromonospora parathelypteridis]|nr:hypothetical protein GCM10011576_19020 [Micromonospora parathelypteridis]
MSVPHRSGTARVAEERGDWDRATAVVGAAAECYGTDYERHNAYPCKLKGATRRRRRPYRP